MARFSFRKQESGPGGEDEGLPPLEGDIGDSEAGVAGPDSPPPDEEGGGRTRRLIILAGIGIILIGGAYLANQLFLAPAPPATVRPTAPPLQAKAPVSLIPKQALPSPAAPTPSTTQGTAKAGPPATPPAAAAKPVTPGPPLPPAKTTTPAKAPPAPSKAGAEPAPRPEGPKAAVKRSLAHAEVYTLQVGAMVVEENAQNLRRRLDENGFQATVRKGTASVAKHVVTVGDPSGKREAEDLARRLNVDGFPSQLLAINGKFTPQIGAFFNLDEAIDLARELQKKNYQPKIRSSSANTVVFQVRHGRFGSRAAALKRGGELKAKGFTYVVVPN
jgi:cell division septation protein DedD